MTRGAWERTRPHLAPAQTECPDAHPPPPPLSPRAALPLCPGGSISPAQTGSRARLLLQKTPPPPGSLRDIALPSPGHVLLLQATRGWVLCLPLLFLLQRAPRSAPPTPQSLAPRPPPPAAGVGPLTSTWKYLMRLQSEAGFCLRHRGRLGAGPFCKFHEALCHPSSEQLWPPQGQRGRGGPGELPARPPARHTQLARPDSE